MNNDIACKTLALLATIGCAKFRLGVVSCTPGESAVAWASTRFRTSKPVRLKVT